VCRAGMTGAQRAQTLENTWKQRVQGLDGWEGGVEEEKMQQGEAALRSNVETVEPWVRDLESRLARLEFELIE
jgi:nuclear migration protein JNM1